MISTLKKTSKGDHTRRVIIIGKTGTGKSTTANTLTSSCKFRSGLNASAITKICQVQCGGNTVVCDTPGLFDHGTPFSKTALEIQKSLEVCPKPHAFLIVLSPERITHDDSLTIDMIRIIFGEKVFKHAIIVFTHGSKFQSKEQFRSYWRGCKLIEDLVKNCKSRVVSIENDDSFNSKQTLFDRIDEISDHGRYFYDYDFLDKHRECLKTFFETNKDPLDVTQEIKVLVVEIGKKIPKHQWRPFLVGAAVGTGALAATGVGVYGLATYGVGAVAGNVVATGGAALRVVAEFAIAAFPFFRR